MNPPVDPIYLYNLAISEQKFRVYRNKKKAIVQVQPLSFAKDTQVNTKQDDAIVNPSVKLQDINLITASKFMKIYMNNKIMNETFNVEKVLKSRKPSQRLVQKKNKGFNKSLQKSQRPTQPLLIDPTINIKELEEDHELKYAKTKTISLTAKIHSSQIEKSPMGKAINTEESKQSDKKKWKRSFVEFSYERKQRLKFSPTKLKLSPTNVTNVNYKKKFHSTCSNHFKQLNIQNIIQRKVSINSFEDSMQQFTKRLEYPPNSKFFIFKSPDTYIKRILLENGWIENTSENSPFFHLKWISNDFAEKYEFYEGLQFFNHFKNNLKMTTKIGLHKEFYLHNEYKVNHFYPRSYDLTSQSSEFKTQYEHSVMLCLLKKHIWYFQTKKYQNNQKISSTKINFFQSHNFLEEILKKQDFYNPQYDQNFQVNIPLIVQLCLYLQNLKQKYLNLPPLYALEQRTIHKLRGYSKLYPPYQVFSIFRKSEFHGQKNQKNDKINKPTQQNSTIQKIVFNDNFNRYTSSGNSFNTPSASLIDLLYIYHQFFKINVANYQNEGMHNIWILKGLSSSKGIGISLEVKKQIILEKGENKIVQKYIENCLIFSNILNENLKHLEKRKFDIRQWVLVKSFDPLSVYVYEDFYLRVCSEEYDLFDLKALPKHLTNFSQNKHNFKEIEDSVVSSQDFIYLLKENYKIDYSTIILPKIQQIIKRVMQNYKNKLVSNESSFELYGIDFLISQDFRPYLLQINLSPACQERTKWLTEMVQEMGKELLSIILPNDYISLGQIPKKKWIPVFPS